jgi:hypothetical protein
VAAVYRNETEQLVVATSRLAETHPPVMALREWLLLFVDYIATKHGMYEVLNSIVGGTSDLYSSDASPDLSLAFVHEDLPCRAPASSAVVTTAACFAMTMSSSIACTSASGSAQQSRTTTNR